MSKDIRVSVARIGRPLRVEVSLSGEWLDRLKDVLRTMDAEGRPYPLQRYLEELIEADVVYREGISSRGPFVPRADIVRWLRRRRAAGPDKRSATSTTRR